MVCTSQPLLRLGLVLSRILISVAYAYVTRRLSVSPLSSLGAKDPDRGVVQDLLSTIVPFLTDRKSALVYRSVDDLVTTTWGKLESVCIIFCSSIINSHLFYL